MNVFSILESKITNLEAKRKNFYETCSLLDELPVKLSHKIIVKKYWQF